MSTSNGVSPLHNSRRRHGNPVSDAEYSDWFDTDGRLVKEAAMREALFHVSVASSHRPCLWKFILGIYPTNSTRRDQKTIDLENRVNYLALRQRWQILDKTIQIPDQEPTIHDHPSYMELSDDDHQDSIYSPSTENSKSSRDNTTQPASTEKPTSTQNEQEILESLEVSLDQSGELCSHCNRLISSMPSSLCDSVNTNSESGFSEVSSSSCDCKKSDQTVSTENGASCTTSGQTSTSASKKGVGCLDETSELCTHISGDTMCGDCREKVGVVKSKGCGCDFRGSCKQLDKDAEALLKILDFPSRVYAARQPVQLETSYPRAKRIILRDVSRTDRNYHYFTHKRNLRKVHRILLIYAMFHPDLGYAQGMNDILARFLVVTNSEVDSYWLFVSYMEKKRDDFLEHSMMRKVALVKKLVKEVDKELYSYFDKSDCHDYLFCHRWLLLDFKREFPFDDSIRMFEVLSSHYLELNSDRALVETDRVLAKEFELDAGETRLERSEVNLEFTFDVFVCVAILTMNSNDICKASDAAGIYGCLNGLSMNMNLNEVLTQAEELFYKYCRQTITRGFAEIDL